MVWFTPERSPRQREPLKKFYRGSDLFKELVESSEGDWSQYTSIGFPQFAVTKAGLVMFLVKEDCSWTITKEMQELLKGWELSEEQFILRVSLRK